MNELPGTDPGESRAVEVLLARNFGPTPRPSTVRLAGLSHPGLVRPNNEDHFMVVERRRTRSVLSTNLPKGFLQPADDVAYVMAVADGLGGEAFGDLASMLALHSGWEQAPTATKWMWIINDREIEDLREQVELVFRRMNQALRDEARMDPACAGMGTTLTGAYTVGDEAFIGHIGDSRAYLSRQGKLTQLTRDQTLAQFYLDAGLPVLCRSWYHKLTHCLGGSETVVPVEFHHIRLEDSDQL